MHPATRRCPEIDRHMPDYRHEAELAALKNRAVMELLRENGVRRIAFADI